MSRAVSSRIAPWTCALGVCVLAILGGARATGQSARSVPSLPPSLDYVRSQLAKYQDPVVAVRDGYLSTLVCIDYPTGHNEGMGHDTTMNYKAGAMGVHFLNFNAVGPTLDSLKPQVLIYEPVGGQLQLIAAEWFVPKQLAPQGPPSIFGQRLQGPMEGHEPVMPAQLYHYDLHVWLWKDNPNGIFSPTNPAVKCPEGPYTVRAMAPKMAPNQ